MDERQGYQLARESKIDAPASRTWAKVTAITPTSNAPPLKYTLRRGSWTSPSSGAPPTWTDSSGGKDSFAWLPPSCVPPNVGDYVLISAAGTDSSTPPVLYYEINAAPGMFLVSLTQNGGTDGNATTLAAPTWTYDVKIGGVQIGTNLTPAWSARIPVSTSKATSGLAHISGNATVLDVAFETASFCSS